MSPAASQPASPAAPQANANATKKRPRATPQKSPQNTSQKPATVSPRQSATILFWWYGIIDTSSNSPDSITLYRVLPPCTHPADHPIPSLRGKNYVPQSLAAFPPDQQAAYPAVYLPITYGDFALLEQTADQRNLSPDDLRTAVQQRGKLIADIRTAAANTHLNWNQTAKQRIKQLSRIGIHCITDFALSPDTSPLFATEPTVKYRGSAIHATAASSVRPGFSGKAKAHRTTTGPRLSPVESAAIRRETAANNNRPLSSDIDPPQDTRTTSHRNRLPPAPLPSTGEPGDSHRPILDFTPQGIWWQRFMAPPVHTSRSFNVPQCIGPLDSTLTPLEGITLNNPSPTLTPAQLRHLLSRRNRRRYLTSRHNATPPVATVSASTILQESETIASLLSSCGKPVNRRYAAGFGVDIVTRSGRTALRLKAVS